jgi:hypothetical protein
MSQSTYEPPSENDGGGDDQRGGGVGDAAAAVAPAAMGSGSATPIAAPEALVGSDETAGGSGAGGDPDREAFNSGEDEVGGTGGPAGGTVRP